MNKKVTISIVLVFSIILLILVVNNVKKTKDVDSNIIEYGPKNGEEYAFEDDSGKKYRAVYDADSFVYKIYDENNQLLFVATDTENLNNYIESLDVIE